MHELLAEDATKYLAQFLQELKEKQELQHELDYQSLYQAAAYMVLSLKGLKKGAIDTINDVLSGIAHAHAANKLHGLNPLAAKSIDELKHLHVTNRPVLKEEVNIGRVCEVGSPLNGFTDIVGYSPLEQLMAAKDIVYLACVNHDCRLGHVAGDNLMFSDLLVQPTEGQEIQRAPGVDEILVYGYNLQQQIRGSESRIQYIEETKGGHNRIKEVVIKSPRELAQCAKNIGVNIKPYLLALRALHQPFEYLETILKGYK